MKKKRWMLLVVLLLGVALFPAAAWAGEGTINLEVSINTMWTLLAGFLVFLMHAGFTMVETGFTRSKNAVNIIMKNFMTISLGVVCYYLMGFALMFGPDAGGFIGTAGFAMSDASLFDFDIPLQGFWFFQAVFAATSATIVSGAMAERTKFTAYIFFCILITAVTYPIIGHWIWGGGWLTDMGFVDFAGSTVVHAVGGFSALVGAWMVGPRLGKYDPEHRPRAIPAHSIPLGALGVLILWFGWFGFNPGSTLSGTTPAIAHIAVTTLLAGAAGAISSMLYSWIRYKKPDASLTLNGCLAGLVAITAGTATVSPAGALIIGTLAGVLLVIAVSFFDRVARIDDPVGAISVHGVCGMFGTIMVGLFSTEGGLFYGGGWRLLGVQTLGTVSSALFAAAAALVVFYVLKKTVGIRVDKREEREGLDVSEHGSPAYGDMQHLLD